MDNTNIMDNDIESVFFSSEQIKETVARLGKQISDDYKDKNLLLVCILKGSVVFMGDLMKEITVPCNIDFMSVSSYGNSTISSGNVVIKKDLDTKDLENVDLLIVEDILDSGNTLYNLKKILAQRNPASIKICTLLDKPERRTAEITADYIGEKIPDAFVVGYGLDYAEKYRNLPYIGVLKPSVYGG